MLEVLTTPEILPAPSLSDPTWLGRSAVVSPCFGFLISVIMGLSAFRKYPMRDIKKYLAASMILAILTATLVSVAEAAERLRTIWRGQWINYVELGDYAIAEGDIIIGSKEDARQWAQAGEHGLERVNGGQKALTIDDAALRWTRGASGVAEVPFTIEAGNAANINAAVAEVNRALAGVLQWVPRTTQADYVAFNLTLPGAGYCASAVGRKGGRQLIVGEPTCQLTTFIHEMGHTIGLHHVQSDADANAFVNIHPERTAPAERSQSAISFNTRTFGGYDYSSVMHYRAVNFIAFPGAVNIESRPMGIDLRAATTYSAADVDAIARLYGVPIPRTIVTSNPVGLQVVVDGVTVTTPASFDWKMGSVHRVWATKDLQTKDGYKFGFGRWGHDANATPSLQYTWQGTPGDGQVGSPASIPSSTVLTANFVRLIDVSFTPASPVGGTSSVVPRSPPWPGTTKLYPQLTTFDLVASRTAGYQNLVSFDSTVTPFNGGLGLRNSVSLLELGASPSNTFGQNFTNGSAIGVDVVGDGMVDPISVNVTPPGAGATTRFAPRMSLATPGVWKFGVSSPQTVSAFMRHVVDGYVGFDNAATGEVAMPATGVRTVTIQAHREMTPYTEVVPACAGTISLSNSSPWVRSGSSLSATVAPATAAIFTGWTGTASGTATTVATTVGTVIPEFVATFHSIAEPLSLTSISKKILGDDSTSTTTTLTGTGFTSKSYVVVSTGLGNVLITPTFVDSHTIRVLVTRNQFSNAGRFEVYVGNALSNTCFGFSNSLAIDVLPVGKSVAVKLVEFYYPSLDYFFLTSDATSIAALDAATTIWKRTGNVINLFSVPSVDTLPLERHYFDKVARAGIRGSHFFTILPSDQAIMTNANPTNAQLPKIPYLEGIEGYAIPKGANGACPANTIPIYRAFKGPPRYVDDGNHRFSTTRAQHDDMINRLGWTDEGIVFCGAQ